jgi:hypothetical protein
MATAPVGQTTVAHEQRASVVIAGLHDCTPLDREQLTAILAVLAAAKNPRPQCGELAAFVRTVIAVGPDAFSAAFAAVKASSVVVSLVGPSYHKEVDHESVMWLRNNQPAELRAVTDTTNGPPQHQDFLLRPTPGIIATHSLVRVLGRAEVFSVRRKNTALCDILRVHPDGTATCLTVPTCTLVRANPRRPRPTPDFGEPALGGVQAETQAPGLNVIPPPFPWPDLVSLAASVPVPDEVPHLARAALADAFGRALHHRGQPNGWWRIFAFAPLVLCPDSAARGGTKDRVRVLQEKAKLFAQGSFSDLAVRASQTLAARNAASADGEGEVGAAFPIDDDSDGRWVTGMATDANAEVVPEARIVRASRLAQRGLHSKAARTLEAAKIAGTTPATIAALRELHPAACPVGVDFLALPDRHDTVLDSVPTEKDLTSLLRAMRCSAAGLSRLFPSVLLELMSVPGTQLQVGLAAAVADIARGHVPADARPFFFGARLAALEKKQGGVRPIACGDVLRRLAGKWLCAKVRKEAGVFFVARQQVGVSQQRGAEGLLHTARRFCDTYADEPEAALLKVDWANAFNSVNREALLQEVRTHFPALSPYAVAAYGTPSVLLYDRNVAIDSAAGVQQGDPLGPLFFSLVLARMWSSVLRAGLSAAEVSFCGWYLDDGVFGGMPRALLCVLASLEEAGAALGLRLNRTKCELRVHPDAIAAGIGAGQVGVIGELTDTTLLGCAVGSRDAHEEHGARVAERVERKIDLIGRMGQIHAHSALATLQQCGGFPMCSHLLHSGGDFSAADDVDAATRRAFASVVVACGDVAWAQAQLPLRLGGFGVRTLVPHAAAASFSSALASLPAPPTFGLANLPPDPLLLSSASTLAAAHPILAGVIAGFQRGEVLVAGGKVQRHLSRAIEDAEADALLAAAGPANTARLQSIRGDKASAWLGVRDADASPWLADAEFRVASRLRLGLPVRDGPCPCPHCGVYVAPTGYHMLVCRSGKHSVHNAVRNRLHLLCCEALLPAHREGQPFAAQGDEHARRRVDIVIGDGPDGRSLLLDVAVVSPFTTAAAIRQAGAAPGGAASLYEATKRGQYLGAVQPLVHNFVPIVADSFGSWGRSALPALSSLAGVFAQRRAETHGDAWRGRALFFAALSLTLQRQIARVVLRCTAVPGPQQRRVYDDEDVDDDRPAAEGHLNEEEDAAH